MTEMKRRRTMVQNSGTQRADFITWCYDCGGDGCYNCWGDESNAYSKWDRLPSDLLLKIQENLNIFDKTQVHYACKSWKSLMPKKDISQPFPFLFLPPKLDIGCCRFYDTVNNKSYKLNKLKLTCDRKFVFRGSSYGWLVALIESGPRICLINPLTGLQIKLPNLTWEGVEVTDKYILSSNPSLSDNYFVVAIYGGFSSLAYTRCGDRTWTTIESDKSFIDIVFYEGELYGLTENLELMHIKNLSSGPQVTQIGPLLDFVPRLSCYNYLVGSSIGLLRIERRTTKQGPSEEAQDHRRSMTDYSTEFHVYKFDFELYQWSDSLADVGENVLFVGRICSMSVPSGDFPKGCSNSIYFMDNCVVPLEPGGCLHMGVFDLETRLVEHSEATFRFDVKIVWPYSIWVTPKY